MRRPKVINVSSLRLLMALEGVASYALLDIGTERRRQVEREGFDVAHDDAHSDGEMARAAATYALSAAPRFPSDLPLIASLWPWERHWLKPRSKREDLVRAGALIVAEIERLDRAAQLSDTHRPEAK